MTKATEKTADPRNIYQRIAAAMQEVDYIQKEKKAGMRYSIVSHDSVTAKVRPALLKQGVIYHPTSLTHEQQGNRTMCYITLRFVNVDNPGDYVIVPSFGYGIDDQDKGPGKAMSYAVKYALLKMLGLETGDDPDHDQDVVLKDEKQEEFEQAIAGATDKESLEVVAELLKDAKLKPVTLQKLRQQYAARMRTFTTTE